MTAVALTFDNGPTVEDTERVLDILRDRQLCAGFFVVGSMLEAPGALALAHRARAEGHWIGNHTMHHDVPLGAHPDPLYGVREIEDVQRLLDEAGLAAPERYFRPFGNAGMLGPHLLSPPALDHLIANRYTMVLWNSVPRDWEGDASWVDRAMADVESSANAEGVVVVLHDVPDGAADQLETFLDRLDAAGHHVTADLPQSCVPIRLGVIERPSASYVSSS